MIYAADAAHDIQPLCVCMIGYPFFYMRQYAERKKVFRSEDKDVG